MIGRAFQSILHHPCSSSIGTPRLKLKKAPQRGWQVTSASKLICRKIKATNNDIRKSNNMHASLFILSILRAAVINHQTLQSQSQEGEISTSLEHASWECASQLVLCITHSASMLRLEVCLCVCAVCVCVCVCVSSPALLQRRLHSLCCSWHIRVKTLKLQQCTWTLIMHSYLPPPFHPYLS